MENSPHTPKTEKFFGCSRLKRELSRKKISKKNEEYHLVDSFDSNLEIKILDKLSSIINNKLSYNCNIKICNVDKNYKLVLSIVKNFLFSTELLFVISINKFFGISRSVCVKFFDPIKYSRRIEAIYQNAIGKALSDNSDIVMNDGIPRKKEILAECYARNYNIILGKFGHEFTQEMVSRKEFVVDGYINIRYFRVYTCI
ncbi:hypothetical protein QLL95_gp0877 [Cotonvirus japonicus]|uniref:Uncharacterized protein n=1 Tax=Cotonvirus japonicus TaxID=2811091 RepID=A0ABM7NT01_9VIRU|nr:hypothetical protein QLL95_gp0877 [Cotonvirus japonicus]BCS83246.1 hypothetical protein [Cotonvirus japonicus]